MIKGYAVSKSTGELWQLGMLNLIFREFEIIQSYKFACKPAGNGRFQVWKVSEVKADFKFIYFKKKSKIAFYKILLP